MIRICFRQTLIDILTLSVFLLLRLPKLLSIYHKVAVEKLDDLILDAIKDYEGAINGQIKANHVSC